MTDQPRGADRTTVEGVEFRGSVEVPSGTVVDGTTVGGLSGIAFDPASGSYLAVSDDRDAGADGTPRFYEVGVDLGDGSLDEGDITLNGTTALTLPSGATLDAISPDPEGIAIGEAGELFISSERDFAGNPAIYEFDAAGVLQGTLPVDSKFEPNPAGTNGVRDNLGFESLTISPERRTLYTASESALVQDGEPATLESGATARIVQYDFATGLPEKEFVYEVGPIANAPVPADAFADSGLVDLVALDERGTLLALERSFSTGAADRGYAVKLYKVETATATDVIDSDRLPASDDEGAPRPVGKELLLDFADLGIPLDNIEGMTLGPVLADGRQSLVIVSDDNFGAFGPQANQFVTLALDLGAQPTAEPMLVGRDGWEAEPLLTVTGELGNGYQPVGVPDGIGAVELDAETVRVFVNHEVASDAGEPYAVDGIELTGARISYFDVDKSSYSITDGGIAYNTIVDASGKVATDASFTFEDKPGFDRFCSGALFEAGQFDGRGLADAIYFAGEETGGGFSAVGGAEWALDVETGTFYALPAFGRGAWENVTEVDTGSDGHVAFVLGDDTAPFDADGDGVNEAAPAYLYVGEKSADPDAGFLARNGLEGGKLHVWVPREADAIDPQSYRIDDPGLKGSWVALDNAPNLALADEAGANGYDEWGYPTQANLWRQAEALGAFRFSRPEDVSTNPEDGTEVVMASTGVPEDFDGVDNAGEVYSLDLDFSKLEQNGKIRGTLDVIYDGDSDPAQELRSPDNLDWADDGFLYVQEDRAGDNLFGEGAVNQANAGIVRLDPESGEVTRIFELDQTAVSPEGAVDVDVAETGAIDVGSWESSGILDVSKLFGLEGGELFLADVQAHSLSDQDGFDVAGPAARLTDDQLVESGQLSFLTAPGTSITVADPVEPVYQDAAGDFLV